MLINQHVGLITASGGDLPANIALLKLLFNIIKY